jgi:hypothetical protein
MEIPGDIMENVEIHRNSLGMNGDFHGEATPEDDCGPKWSHKTADV